MPGAVPDTSTSFSPMRSPQNQCANPDPEVAFGEEQLLGYGSTDKPTAAQSKEVCILIAMSCIGHTNCFSDSAGLFLDIRHCSPNPYA